MNGDLDEEYLTEYDDLLLYLVKDAVLTTGMKQPRIIELPPGFDAQEDPQEAERFFKQVIRHGGCPKRHLSGLMNGALTGTGWISFPNIIQSSMKTYFWNSDGEWLWHEDGSGRGCKKPKPNTEMMKALVREIGKVPAFNKNAPYDRSDTNEDDNDSDEDEHRRGMSVSGTGFSAVSASESGTGYSTVTDSSAARSYAFSSGSDATSRYTYY